MQWITSPVDSRCANGGTTSDSATVGFPLRGNVMVATRCAPPAITSATQRRGEPQVTAPTEVMPAGCTSRVNVRPPFAEYANVCRLPVPTQRDRDTQATLPTDLFPWTSLHVRPPSVDLERVAP